MGNRMLRVSTSREVSRCNGTKDNRTQLYINAKDAHTWLSLSIYRCIVNNFAPHNRLMQHAVTLNYSYNLAIIIIVRYYRRWCWLDVCWAFTGSSLCNSCLGAKNGLKHIQVGGARREHPSLRFVINWATWECNRLISDLSKLATWEIRIRDGNDGSSILHVNVSVFSFFFLFFFSIC